jgi:hypothetical protein
VGFLLSSAIDKWKFRRDFVCGEDLTCVVEREKRDFGRVSGFDRSGGER